MNFAWAHERIKTFSESVDTVVGLCAVVAEWSVSVTVMNRERPCHSGRAPRDLESRGEPAREERQKP